MRKPEFNECVDVWLGKGGVDLGLLHPDLRGVGTGELMGQFVTNGTFPRDATYDSLRVAAIGYDTDTAPYGRYAVLTSLQSDNDATLEVRVFGRNGVRRIRDDRPGVVRLGHLSLVLDGSCSSMLGTLRLAPENRDS